MRTHIRHSRRVQVPDRLIECIIVPELTAHIRHAGTVTNTDRLVESSWKATAPEKGLPTLPHILPIAWPGPSRPKIAFSFLFFLVQGMLAMMLVLRESCDVPTPSTWPVQFRSGMATPPSKTHLLPPLCVFPHIMHTSAAASTSPPWRTAVSPFMPTT